MNWLEGIPTGRKYRIFARFLIIVVGVVALYGFSVLVQERNYAWAVLPTAIIAFLSVMEFVVVDLLIDARFSVETAEMLERLSRRVTVHKEILRGMNGCVDSFRACDKTEISSVVHLHVTVTGPGGKGLTEAYVQLSDYTNPGLGGRRWRVYDSSKGIVGRCLRSKRMDCVNFQSKDDYRRRMVSEFGYTDMEVTTRTRARSYLAYSLIDKNAAVGVLYFFSTEPQVFPHAADEVKLRDTADHILGLLRGAEIFPAARAAGDYDQRLIADLE